MSEPTNNLEFLDDDARRDFCVNLIEEFGGQVIKETDKGELRHKCTLPFGHHTDGNSVTASVNYKTLAANCWVCKNGGSLLWWIAANRGEGTEQTTRWLRDHVKVDGDQMLTATIALLDGMLEDLRTGRKSGRLPISVYDPRILGPWTKWAGHLEYLTDPPSEQGRNIPPATLDEFQVGFCDYDPHWGYVDRVMIPVFWQGDLVGWQARRLNPDDPNPAKYLNSPDFPRDRVLYGPPDSDWAVVVESPMSKLRHHHHLPLVSTLGSAVTATQRRALHRYERLVLFMDNDKAGYSALLGTKGSPGLIDDLFPYVQVEIVQNPFDADPADLDDDDMEELVGAAVLPGAWTPPDPEFLRTYVSKE